MIVLGTRRACLRWCEVTNFWFDTNIGAFTLEFVGAVGVVLNVVDARTGGTVLSRS